MPTWLLGFLGFVGAFVAVFVLELVASIAHPSLWLPIAFALCFGTILSLAPRIRPAAAAGFGLLFAAGSCGLWLVSSSERWPPHDAIKGLALVGVLGFFWAFAGWIPKPRAAIGTVVVLMALGWLLSYFSSSRGGASPMVEWVMRTFGFGKSTAETVVVVFRKSIHITFYGLVAWLGVSTCARNGGKRILSVLVGLLFALSYACFDEMRQSTQPDRVGSAWDVLLDMAGAAIAVGLASGFKRRSALVPRSTQK